MHFAPRSHLLRHRKADDEIRTAIDEQSVDEVSAAIAQLMGFDSPPSKRYVSSFLSEPEAPKYGPKYLTKLISDYSTDRHIRANDMTRRVPPKTVRKEPKSWMGGVLGYTVLNEGWITLRDDLVGERKEMVDVHESIHTPDEYETRVITTWMLSDEPPRSMQY